MESAGCQPDDSFEYRMFTKYRLHTECQVRMQEMYAFIQCRVKLSERIAKLTCSGDFAMSPRIKEPASNFRSH